ncbi:MAG: glycoside hydrolase family 172 protein [bacterium]
MANKPLLFSLLFLTACFFLIIETAPAQVPDGLERLIAVERLPQFRSQRMLQTSSYDRTGGNDDGFAGTYSTLRKENGEYVFFENEGPGVVYRIWTASYEGGLDVYFDGNDKPAYSAPIKKFLSGKVEPLVSPLCQFAGGGLTCYFPLQYEKSIKMTLDTPPLFFHVNYAKAEQPISIASSTPENLASQKELINAAATLLSERGAPLSAAAVKGKSEKFSAAIEPGKEVKAWETFSGGKISEIRIGSENLDARALKEIRLRIYWDGENTPAVDTSLLRLFALDFEKKNFRSLFVGHGESEFYCRFPMPFAKSARMTFANESNEAVAIKGETFFAGEAMTEDYGYFHVGQRRIVAEEGEHITVNDISGGRGHWVGTAISVIRPKGVDDNFGYLEGDEKVYIDGDETPIWHGTGTEDYFSGAWYFGTRHFSRSLFGAPVMLKNRSKISMYRFHLADAIPFEKSIRFDIEHGAANNATGVLYDVVSYWYQEAPGKTGL